MLKNQIAVLFTAFIFMSGCNVKVANQANLARLKAAGPDITVFDVPSTKLQAGAALNIPFTVTPAEYTDVSSLTLQYASDGVNFIDVAPIDPADTVIVWNVPKVEVGNAKLQLTASSSTGKSTSKQSSSFSTSINPLNSSLFSVSSANPTGSTGAFFTISDCTNRASIYVSESKTTPLVTDKSWITCSTAPGSIPWNLNSKEGVKTIYFWTQDKDQNISDPVSVQVTLDKTGPTLSFTNAPIAGSTVTGGSIFALGFSAIDSISGIANIKVQYSSDNGATFSDLATLASTATSYNWTIPTAAVASAKLKIIAQDSSGNLSSLETSAFSIVLTAPTISITSPLASTYANASNYTSLPVSGSCSAEGGSVTVTASDGTHTATASAICDLLSTPNWTINLDLTSLNNSSVNLSAIHTNAVGTSTTSSTVTITKDSTNPTLSITTPTILNPINSSNKASFSVSGSCSENTRTVTVSATDGTNTISATPTCNTGASPNFSTSLNLTGLIDGTITFSATQTDVAGNSGSATTVSVTKDVAVPVVSSVSTSSSSGTYVVGSTISIQVNFSKTVNVTGTPQLTVATGSISTSRALNYTSGTGTNALTFNYTVQNGDYSSQLNYLNTSSLALNGGTIQDSATNNATLTLPATGSTTSLAGTSTASSKTIKINSATLAQSTLATNLGSGTCTTASSCKKTQTTNLVLTTKDSASNPMSLGGLTVTFSASTGAGVSTGNIGSVTDNGDGTYSAVFTATASGTATTITANISGLGAVASTTTVIVTNAAPVITPLATKTYPLDGGAPPAIQGSSVTLATATDADNDTITLSCTYKTLGLNTSDPNYAAAGTNCSNLDTITTSGSPATTVTGKLSPTTTGSLIWTPTNTQRGTYQFTINGTDGVANAASQTVTVAVRAGYTTTNLLSSLDALNATNASGLSASTPSAPFTTADSAGSCLNLLSSASNGSLTFGTTNPWGGTGQSSTSSVDPYALTFNKNNSDSLSLGTVMNAATEFSAEVWVKPSPLPSASPAPIIVGNGGGTGNGFVLRQSSTMPDRAELIVGQKYYSYSDLVLSDKPVGYWRLGEMSGTTAADLTAYGNNGTYNGGYTQGQTGSIANDSNTSTLFDGSTGYVSISPSGALKTATDSNYSLEAWVKLQNLPPVGCGVNSSTCTGAILARPGYHLGLSINNAGVITASFYDSSDTWYGTSIGGITAGTWHHVVMTTDTSQSKFFLYLDGALASSNTYSNTPRIYGTANYNIGFASPASPLTNGSYAYPLNGFVNDAAVYNYALTATQVTEHYQTGHNGNYKAYPGNAVLADKPVGYWRFGEKSGTIAYDSSGNGYDATLSGGYTQGQTGALANDADRATQLDGTTGRAFSSTIPVNTSQSGVTMEGWFKIIGANNTNTYQFIFNSNSSPDYRLGYSTTYHPFIDIGAWSSGTGDLSTSTVTFNVGQWYHYVAVGYLNSSGTTSVKVYINGALSWSPTSPNSTFASWTGAYIGKDQGGSNFYANAVVDEVAFYNYPLSAVQVANHYNSGNGPGWWTCQSQTKLTNSNWNLMSALYDGTTAKLFVNGQQECSVTPGTTYSGTVANTVIGSNPGRTSNFWQGILSSVKIFGTSDATAPATATTIKTNFDSEANRYRSVPLENIVTSGLILNLDAANAKQGLAPYSNGCANSDLSWFNLSLNGISGTLFNFSTCTTTGWLGSGTASNPYRISFDGTDDYVKLGNNTAFDLTSQVTLEAWFYVSNNTQNGTLISKWTNALGTNNSYLLYLGQDTGLTKVGFMLQQTDSTIRTLNPANLNYNANVWNHLVGVADGTKLHIYLNGVEADTTINYNGTIATSVKQLLVGKLREEDALYRLGGSIAVSRIYNRGLTAQEIKQNCLAQEHRFTNTPQIICAAP